MTPAELNALVEARDERERTIWFREAWFTYWLIIAPYLKRRLLRSLEPEKLLPKFMRKLRKAKSRDQARRELEELKKELKVE